MKKMTKKSKAGFTLLEVLLATVILTIASTMIMKGFIAVMVFANNNKGFAKQAAANNRAAIQKFMVDYATGDQQDSINNAYAGANHDQITMTIISGATPANMSTTLNIVTEAFTDQGGLTDAEGNPYPLDIDGTAVASTTLASNRYAFFYNFAGAYRCPVDASHPVRYGYQVSGGSPTNFGFYCFSGCLTPDDETDDCPNYANGTVLARVAVPT